MQRTATYFSPREWEFPWKQIWKALHWQARPTNLWKSIGGGRSKGLNRGHQTGTRAKKTRPHLILVCKMPENICKGHVSLTGRSTVRQALRRPADALRCWALLATALKERRCCGTGARRLERPATSRSTALVFLACKLFAGCRAEQCRAGCTSAAVGRGWNSATTRTDEGAQLLCQCEDEPRMIRPVPDASRRGRATHDESSR